MKVTDRNDPRLMTRELISAPDFITKLKHENKSWRFVDETCPNCNTRCYCVQRRWAYPVATTATWASAGSVYYVHGGIAWYIQQFLPTVHGQVLVDQQRDYVENNTLIFLVSVGFVLLALSYLLGRREDERLQLASMRDVMNFAEEKRYILSAHTDLNIIENFSELYVDSLRKIRSLFEELIEHLQLEGSKCSTAAAQDYWNAAMAIPLSAAEYFSEHKVVERYAAILQQHVAEEAAAEHKHAYGELEKKKKQENLRFVTIFPAYLLTQIKREMITKKLSAKKCAEAFAKILRDRYIRQAEKEALLRNLIAAFFSNTDAYGQVVEQAAANEIKNIEIFNALPFSLQTLIMTLLLNGDENQQNLFKELFWYQGFYYSSVTCRQTALQVDQNKLLENLLHGDLKNPAEIQQWQKTLMILFEGHEDVLINLLNANPNTAAKILVILPEKYAFSLYWNDGLTSQTKTAILSTWLSSYKDVHKKFFPALAATDSASYKKIWAVTDKEDDAEELRAHLLKILLSRDENLGYELLSHLIHSHHPITVPYAVFSGHQRNQLLEKLLVNNRYIDQANDSFRKNFVELTFEAINACETSLAQKIKRWSQAIRAAMVTYKDENQNINPHLSGTKWREWQGFFSKCLSPEKRHELLIAVVENLHRQEKTNLHASALFYEGFKQAAEKKEWNAYRKFLTLIYGRKYKQKHIQRLITFVTQIHNHIAHLKSKNRDELANSDSVFREFVMEALHLISSRNHTNTRGNHIASLILKVHQSVLDNIISVIAKIHCEHPLNISDLKEIFTSVLNFLNIPEIDELVENNIEELEKTKQPIVLMKIQKEAAEKQKLAKEKTMLHLLGKQGSEIGFFFDEITKIPTNDEHRIACYLEVFYYFIFCLPPEKKYQVDSATRLAVVNSVSEFMKSFSKNAHENQEEKEEEKNEGKNEGKKLARPSAENRSSAHKMLLKQLTAIVVSENYSPSAKAPLFFQIIKSVDGSVADDQVPRNFYILSNNGQLHQAIAMILKFPEISRAYAIAKKNTKILQQTQKKSYSEKLEKKYPGGVIDAAEKEDKKIEREVARLEKKLNENIDATISMYESVSIECLISLFLPPWNYFSTIFLRQYLTLGAEPLPNQMKRDIETTLEVLAELDESASQSYLHQTSKCKASLLPFQAVLGYFIAGKFKNHAKTHTTEIKNILVKSIDMYHKERAASNNLPLLFEELGLPRNNYIHRAALAFMVQHMLEQSKDLEDPRHLKEMNVESFKVTELISHFLNSLKSEDIDGDYILLITRLIQEKPNLVSYFFSSPDKNHNQLLAVLLLCWHRGGNQHSLNEIMLAISALAGYKLHPSNLQFKLKNDQYGPVANILNSIGVSEVEIKTILLALEKLIVGIDANIEHEEKAQVGSVKQALIQNPQKSYDSFAENADAPRKKSGLIQYADSSRNLFRTLRFSELIFNKDPQAFIDFLRINYPVFCADLTLGSLKDPYERIALYIEASNANWGSRLLQEIEKIFVQCELNLPEAQTNKFRQMYAKITNGKMTVTSIATEVENFCEESKHEHAEHMAVAAQHHFMWPILMACFSFEIFAKVAIKLKNGGDHAKHLSWYALRYLLLRIHLHDPASKTAWVVQLIHSFENNFMQSMQSAFNKIGILEAEQILIFKRIKALYFCHNFLMQGWNNLSCYASYYKESWKNIQINLLRETLKRLGVKDSDSEQVQNFYNGIRETCNELNLKLNLKVFNWMLEKNQKNEAILVLDAPQIIIQEP